MTVITISKEKCTRSDPAPTLTGSYKKKHLLQVTKYRGTNNFQEYEPNVKRTDIQTGFSYYLRNEEGKGRGVQVAEDFKTTEKQVLMVGPAPHPVGPPQDKRNPICPDYATPTGSTVYEWGGPLFYGKNKALFTRESGLMPANQAVVAVNTTHPHQNANCFLSSCNKGYSAIRAKKKGTLKKGEFLNVSTYAVAGPLSRRGMCKEVAQAKATRQNASEANRNAGIGRIICSKCGTILHRKSDRTIHRFQCS